MYIDQAIEEMKQVFKDFPYGVEHTLSVLGYAQAILDGEGITGTLRETAALAAVFHDIGFVAAEEKHGSMAAPYQELEGPPIAREILTRIEAPEEMIERVCYIVGHHHQIAKIDGIDFQILWEADCIENTLYNRKEKAYDTAVLCRTVEKNFKTAAGRSLAVERFGIQGACQ